jgi:amino acid transporter
MPDLDTTPSHHRLAPVFHFVDLFPLSVSSVGPVFSVAATGGVMAAYAGWWAIPAIAVLAAPFVVASFVFRLLNRHFPHAGASYHWSARILGRTFSRYQAWILILAYFLSIPPIAIPAGSYTLALLDPGHTPSNVALVATTLAWIIFAAIPLLLGARPTAQITKVFMVIEMVSLAAIAVLGIARFSATHVPIHFGPPPIGGMLIVAVIAATVLDGWEIDSYAAEESRRPRTDPGMSGIIGAFLALLFYAILYPLIYAETPMRLLASANDSDPIALWAQRVLPTALHWTVLIPILGSTAGGLWLTTYILTRALYAMGRENLIPASFGRTSSRRVPHVATVVVLGLTLIVVALQTFVSSLTSFFGLVLSAAGFFLLAEFFSDTVTAIVFLVRAHRSGEDHQHPVLLGLAILSALLMAGLMVAFFIFGPKAIGNGIDQVVAALLGLGVLFVVATRRRALRFVAFVPEGADD